MMFLLPQGRGISRASSVLPTTASMLMVCAALTGCGNSASDGGGGTTNNNPDAAATGKPTLCTSSMLFCDGFEQGLTHWSQSYLAGGTVTVDSTHVYRGTHALHAHVDPVTMAGTTTHAYVQQIQTLPSHFFARLFAYQPSPLAPSPVGLIDLVQGSTPYAGIEVLTDPPSGNFSMKTYNTGQDLNWKSKGTETSPGEWKCFELEVDTNAEMAHLYVDGNEVSDLTQGNLGMPQLGIIGVGLSFYLPNVQGAQDGWIDEVAVSDTRIGCGN